MRAKGILYQQEVVNFLNDFLYHSGDAAPHKPPLTAETVIEDITEFWAEMGGFLQPVNLRKMLLEEYLNDDNDEKEIVDLATVLGKLRFDNRDPMTGYMRKTELGIVSGLAHLYARISNEPCAIIELDYSNMGGTNEFFRDLIAKAEGIAPEDVDMARAESLTDKAAGLIAETVIDVLEKSGSPETVILPVRAGGDELRIIATDIDPKEFKKIQMRAHHQIEMLMARLGLMDHDHKKYPGNPHKTGFGAAISVADLRFIHPETYSEKADKQIDIEKVVLGCFRAGVSPPLDVAEKSAFVENVFLMADGEQSPLGILASAAMLRHESYKAAAVLAGTNNNHQTPKQRLSNIENEMSALAKLTDYGDEKTYGVGMFNNDAPPYILDKNAYNPALLYMSVSEEYEWRLVQLLEEQKIDTDPYEMEMLHAALMGLSPIDPAAGVLTPRDMPRQLEIYLRDVAVHIEHLLPILVEEDKTRAQRRAGPIHEGLRLAHKTPQELKDVKPIIMGVAFHNLAGLNKVFGHDNANKALRFMAHKIITDSIGENGLKDDDYALAHEGGGAFTIIFKPIIEDKKGFINIPGQPLMALLEQEFERRIEDLNELSPEEFMDVLGMQLDNPDVLAEFDMDTMADLPDQKHRKWMNGLHASTVISDLSGQDIEIGKTRMGKILHDMKVRLEGKVEHDRAMYKALFEYEHPDQKIKHKQTPPKR